MKRNYVTPAIAVEYYNLTQSIAVCATKFNLLGATCIISDEDATDQMRNLALSGWFMPGGCVEDDMEIAVGMGEENGFCYHTNTNAAFNS